MHGIGCSSAQKGCGTYTVDFTPGNDWKVVLARSEVPLDSEESSFIHLQDYRCSFTGSAYAGRLVGLTCVMLDSGASFHFISRKHLTPEQLESIRLLGYPIEVETVNGIIVVSERISLTLPALWDHEVEFLVVDPIADLCVAPVVDRSLRLWRLGFELLHLILELGSALPGRRVDRAPAAPLWPPTGLPLWVVLLLLPTE